jgi:hypothetical protein
VVPGGLTGLVAVLTAFLYRNRGKRFVIRHQEREIELEGISAKQAHKLLTEFFPDPQPGAAGAGTAPDTAESGIPRDTGEAGTAPASAGEEPPPDGNPEPDQPRPSRVRRSTGVSSALWNWACGRSPQGHGLGPRGRSAGMPESPNPGN